MKLVFVVAVLALGANLLVTDSAYAGELSEEIDARRHELIASRDYARTCKKLNKKFSKAYAQQNSAYAVAPLCRIPPRYPEKCAKGANPREVISFVFDVDSGGFTQNVRVLRASNECLIEAATSSLLLWTYEPTPDGAVNLETEITFELAN